MAKKKTTQEIERDLIQAVQDRPCLYLKSDPGYKDRNLRVNNWDAIGVIVDKSGKDCKDLWSKLRAQFVAFLARQKAPSGSGTKAKPFFRHEAVMMFLKDTVDPSESTFSNVEESDTETGESGSETAPTDQPDSEGKGIVMQSQNVVAVAPTISVSKPIKDTNKRKKMEEADKEILEMLKNANDEFDSYAEVVAAKLRGMALQSRPLFLITQRKINDAIYDAEMEMLNKA